MMAHMPVAFTAVQLTDRLWAPRQRAVRERTVPFLYGQMEKIGTIEATKRVPFKAVPYHVWDHREAGEMQVWLRET